MISLILIILSVIYVLICLYFYVGIYRISPQKRPNKYTVSVIIAARNEADHILTSLQSLADQTYPESLYEVIVVDDRSTDATAGIVQEFIQSRPQFKLLRHQPPKGNPTYKKHALNLGIQHSNAEIIMTVDADTTVQNTWIETMINCFKEDTGLVAGLVTFYKKFEKTFFHKLQTLEFAGIVFCGVGALGNNRPIMCNGANLAYRRSAFDAAGGYQKYLDLPSGDDDLLLQEIHAGGKWKVLYCLDASAINYSRPVDTVPAFFNQRARWASKSTRYPAGWIFLLLLLIYLFYLAIFFGPLFILLNLISWKIYAIAFFMKMLPEILILSKAVEYLKRRNLLPIFWIGQIFQVPYLLIAGMLGFVGQFKWKENQ